MRAVHTIFCFIIILPLVLCQENVLTLEAYLDNVLINHPIVKKIELLEPYSEAMRKSARGVLDPKIAAQFDWKQYDDKVYYRDFESKAILPLKFGADIVVGYERASGIYLNAESTLPQNGLLLAGVQMPLLQGLKYNNRKFALDFAEVQSDMNTNDQMLLLNDLLFEASQVYTYWQLHEQAYVRANEALYLAEKRKTDIVAAVIAGDRPGIDSIEINSLIFDRLIIRNTLEMNRSQSKNTVESYLWNGSEPLLLADNIKPETLEATSSFWESKNIENFIVDEHPYIQNIENKVDQLGLKMKLLKEYRKPTFNVGYFPIAEPFVESAVQNIGINDAKLRLNASLPIINNTYNGQIEMNQIEQEQLMFTRESMRRDLTIKSDNAFVQVENSRRLQADQKAATENAEMMLNAENIKFNIGESSVFLVNTRENKLIDNQLKLLKFALEYQLAVQKRLSIINRLVDIPN